MNIHTKTSTSTAAMSPAEWEARVDLAAVYRLVAHHGWDDVIYNHCSMRVPGEDRKFLMKQHELLWTEVTASNCTTTSTRARESIVPASRCTAACCAGAPTSTARCTSTRGPAWRSVASRAGCE